MEFILIGFWLAGIIMIFSDSNLTVMFWAVPAGWSAGDAIAKVIGGS